MGEERIAVARCPAGAGQPFALAARRRAIVLLLRHAGWTRGARAAIRAAQARGPWCPARILGQALGLPGERSSLNLP
jgi:hypothetical protein